MVLFRQAHSNSSYHYLQYFLILLYVYGYYSLWSGILLSLFMQIDNVEWVAMLLTRMGAPFIMVSQLMLLLWAARMQHMPALAVVAAATLVSALVVTAYSQWGHFELDNIRLACSVVALVTATLVAAMLSLGEQKIVSNDSRLLLIALVSAAGLMHLSLFSPLSGYTHFDSAFVLAFYLFNTALVVVYSYHATEELAQTTWSLDDFLLKHGISKREADVLRGIYDGKTNQEIANQLFISLQTVKDHSSRIYQKTHVKNRAQLTTLVRESQIASGSAARP